MPMISDANPPVERASFGVLEVTTPPTRSENASDTKFQLPQYEVLAPPTRSANSSKW